MCTDGERVMRERRRMPRYRLDSGIAVDDSAGRSIDLSGTGMFFEATRAFAVGDQVTLTFPFQHAGPRTVVTCRAEVVRVEPQGTRFVVAVTYEPVAFDPSW
jgi:hypothetical protein